MATAEKECALAWAALLKEHKAQEAKKRVSDVFIDIKSWKLTIRDDFQITLLDNYYWLHHYGFD